MVVIKNSSLDECSGMATSLKYADLVYICNDEPGAIFCVNPKTGAVVGTFTLKGVTLVDPESMAMDNCGNLWIADIGDNDENRANVKLYKLPEPGPGNHKLLASTKYTVQYNTGPTNAEAFIINPITSSMWIMSKKEGHGYIYSLPKNLSTSGTNTAKRTGSTVPQLVSDATYVKSGKYVLVRSAAETNKVIVLTNRWKYVTKIPVQKLPKPETISVHRQGTSFYIGTEIKKQSGSNSLLTVNLQNTYR